MDKIFKKKIFHRAKYRGIKELDIIFDRFIKRYGDNLNLHELKQLQDILEIPDNLLLDLILGKKKIPANLKNKTLKNLISISYDWS